MWGIYSFLWDTVWVACLAVHWQGSGAVDYQGPKGLCWWWQWGMDAVYRLMLKLPASLTPSMEVEVALLSGGRPKSLYQSGRSINGMCRSAPCFQALWVWPCDLGCCWPAERKIPGVCYGSHQVSAVVPSCTVRWCFIDPNRSLPLCLIMLDNWASVFVENFLF